MHHDKKQLEILLLKYFRESYSDFPKGIVTPSESPDFIVSFKNHQLLGIELTRLNPGNLALRTPDKITQINIRERIIDLACEIFENHFPHRLFVKFLFSDKTLEQSCEMILAVKISAVIQNKVKNKRYDSFFSISINKNELPEELETILIVNHPGLKNSVWERSNNLGVSNNVVDDIRTAISKKDEKIYLYQKRRLNYYWLLIFTDCLRGVRKYNLAEKVRNHKFESKFQKVFLFDLVKSDIYDLI